MKKENFVLIGSIIILLGALLILQKATNEVNKMIPIYLDTKKDECIKSGGQYSVFDYSLKDDGSDYRVICEIPEKKLWQINLRK